MTDFSKMGDRELDAKCAEGMGWKWMRLNGFDLLLSPQDYAHVSGPAHEECDECVFYTEGAGGAQFVKDYSTDLNAARELEDEIERRDLRIPYMDALVDVIFDYTEDSWATEWGRIHATARQRAEAFCVVMEASQGNA